MKKIALSLIVSASLLSCQSKIEGEGMANIEQTFAVDVFEQLSIDCHCEVTLIPSEDAKIVVESHQNIIDNLVFNTKKAALNINENAQVKKSSLYNVHVYYSPILHKISLNGKTQLKTAGTLKAEEMTIQLRDASHLTQTFSEIKNLNIELADQSNVQMSGTVIHLKVNANDDSNANLAQLQAVDVEFKTKKSSQLSVYAMKTLEGKATDNARVFYSGNPKKNTTEKDQAVIQQK